MADILPLHREGIHSQDRHREFAVQIVKFLEARGVKARFEDDPTDVGYFIVLEGKTTPAAGFKPARHLVEVLRDLRPGSPDVKIGFQTKLLLNRLAGLPGAARYSGGRDALAFSVRELLGTQVYSEGKHEIGHRDRSRDPKGAPQIWTGNVKWPKGTLAGKGYPQGFGLEEVNTTYPVSLKEEASRAKNLLEDARKLAEFPELREAVMEEAGRALDRVLLEGKVMAEMYEMTHELAEQLRKNPSSKLKVISAQGGNADRALQLPGGELLYFRSDQAKAWVQKRYNRTDSLDAWSWDPVNAREMVFEEHAAMGPPLQEALTTIKDLLEQPEFKDRLRPPQD